MFVHETASVTGRGQAAARVTIFTSWLRGTVAERPPLAGKLSLSCAQPAG